MAYVERDASSAIISAFARPQPGRAFEFVADDDPEVVGFLSRARPIPGPSDVEVRVRAIERKFGAPTVQELDDARAELEAERRVVQ